MKLNVMLCAVALSLGATANAYAHTKIYTTTLSGAAEAPPNDSLGTGTAKVTMDFDLVTMRVEVSFSGLTGTTTNAHIHCCTLPTAGVATMQPTFLGFPSGVTSGSYDHTFDMTLATSYNPTFITASGGSVGAALSALEAGMDAGTAYVNIHSSFRSGGEIRGFLALQPIPEPETYALMLAGLGLVGWSAARRRKH